MSAYVAIVVPTWNGLRHVGEEGLVACFDAAMAQRGVDSELIVVDNGSDDDTVAWLRRRYPSAEVVALSSNHGFAGGVNAGIRRAMERDAKVIALLNNDAVPQPDWLARLLAVLDGDPDVGIATCRFLRDDGRIDSTGDRLTTWGLPLPRGRDEPDDGRYDSEAQREIFAASGGATVLRCTMLEDVGLFDERFFAYYEDVDLAFRARLRGWRVRYEPSAVAHHGLNRTSAAMPGFVEYHSLKNLLLLWTKDVPATILLRHGHRFAVMLAFRISFTIRRAGIAVTGRALLEAMRLLPSALADRRRIQRSRVVAPDQIEALLDHDWRPNTFGGPRPAGTTGTRP